MSKNGKLLFKQDSFSGIVRDIGTGKQPSNSVNTATNVVYDRERGSFVSRYDYEASLARPSGVSTLSHWITKPVTYPSAQDIHLWFTEDGIFQRPYWHNSATATDDWVKATDSVSLSLTLSDVTINGSTTNTFVLASATTTYGLSATSNYYKNWVLCLTDGSQNSIAFLIKSYSVTTGTATFTLDNIIDTATGATYDKNNIAECSVHRYFHSDKTQTNPQSSYFAPSFTDPAGYSTETAVRWSGGQGSTVGYKNCKTGYVNRLFFANSGASVRHQFTGTYIDQAECKAPSSGILTSLSVADIATSLIVDTAGYDDKNFLASQTHWAATGSGHTSALSQMGIPDPINIGKTLYKRGLRIVASTAPGGDTSNCIRLSNTYTNNLTAATYRVRVKGIPVAPKGGTASAAFVNVVVSKSDLSVNYASPVLAFPVANLGGGDVESEQTFEFTSAITDKPVISVFLSSIGDGSAYEFLMTAITVELSSALAIALEDDKTYKFYASYVYDGTQESELTFLDSEYVAGKFSRLSYELNQKLGALNKFITAIRLYVAQEAGQTTSVATTASPKHLIATIQIDDDATSTWTFDTAQGRFEYIGYLNGLDWINRGITWEQKTGRTASASTTCSYSIATQASGRIFTAKDYDYADRASYSNRLRYTGFNGDGAPTPDIFPNIQDLFITTITAGQSQTINNIVEYEGDVKILKKKSVLRLGTSNPNPLYWELDLIKDGIGTQSKYAAFKTERGLLFSDKDGIYLENGGFVTDLTERGLWKYYYKSLVANDTKAASQRLWFQQIDGTYNLAYDTSAAATNFFKFTLENPSPVLHQNTTDGGTDGVNNIVTTSDGVVHFAPTSIGNTALKYKDGYSQKAVTCSIDTGYRNVDIDKRVMVNWIYYIAEANNDNVVATIYGLDISGNAVTLATNTTAVNGRDFVKFQTSEDIPVKAVKITFSCAQTDQSVPFKLHEWGFGGNIVEEFTDTNF